MRLVEAALKLYMDTTALYHHINRRTELGRKFFKHNGEWTIKDEDVKFHAKQKMDSGFINKKVKK